MRIPLTNLPQLVFWLFSILLRMIMRGICFLVRYKFRQLGSLMNPGRK
jgi:hypothetical protein